MAEVNNSSRNTTDNTAITLSAHISRSSIRGELFNKVQAVGNCLCDLASHLAQHLRTIQMVMLTMRAMAVMAISVLDIIVIAVLILCQRASRQITMPKTAIRSMSRSSIMCGRCQRMIKVRKNSCRVHMVTMAISMTVFKMGRQQ